MADESDGPAGVTAAALQRELATPLFAQGRVSLGRAMAMAEMDRLSFPQFLGERRIATAYGGIEDWLREEADLRREGLIP
ncbi:MAG: UPF0175 family protein [Acidobacteria bacterium]|nr:UPF0175 family protein [Acidobacteriota bacterium]